MKNKSKNKIKNKFKNKKLRILMLILSIPVALKQRKIIQSKRVIKEDIFLKIKPPKFD